MWLYRVMKIYMSSYFYLYIKIHDPRPKQSRCQIRYRTAARAARGKDAAGTIPVLRSSMSRKTNVDSCESETEDHDTGCLLPLSEIVQSRDCTRHVTSTWEAFQLKSSVPLVLCDVSESDIGAPPRWRFRCIIRNGQTLYSHNN